MFTLAAHGDSFRKLICYSLSFLPGPLQSDIRTTHLNNCFANVARCEGQGAVVFVVHLLVGVEMPKLLRFLCCCLGTQRRSRGWSSAEAPPKGPEQTCHLGSNLGLGFSKEKTQPPLGFLSEPRSGLGPTSTGSQVRK